MTPTSIAEPTDDFEIHFRLLHKLLLNGARIRFSTEDELQRLMALRLAPLGDGMLREFRLDGRSRLDFFWEPNGIAIEAKIKGGPSATFRQVERYTRYEQVKAVVLFRHHTLDIPDTLNNKPVRVIEYWRYLI